MKYQENVKTAGEAVELAALGGLWWVNGMRPYNERQPTGWQINDFGYFPVQEQRWPGPSA